jgi:hypothetical protein
MTRDAVAEGFDLFLDRLVDRAYREFDTVAALTGASGPGSGVVDSIVSNSRLVEERVVEPELRAIRRSADEQFESLLDVAADPDTSFEAVADDLLAADVFVDALCDDLPAARRTAIEDRVLARHQDLARAVEPLVESEETAFWAALHDAFERETAVDLVESQFALADPVLDEADAFRFETTVDPGEVLDAPLTGAIPPVTLEYTDEAFRAIRRAQDQVVEETTREIRRRFDG